MELTKYKLRDLVDVTRGMSLSGQFYAEEGEFIRLTLGNFNMNGGGFKENTSKTDLYFTGTVKDEFILKKGDIILVQQLAFLKVKNTFKVRMLHWFVARRIASTQTFAIILYLQTLSDSNLVLQRNKQRYGTPHLIRLWIAPCGFPILKIR